MELVLTVLAILGGVALALRLFRTLFRFLFASAESAAAAGLAGVSARRGDLSAMADRRSVATTARGARRRQGLLAALWLLLLVVPLFLGWTREVYAVASILWILPFTAIRGRRSVRK